MKLSVLLAFTSVWVSEVIAANTFGRDFQDFELGTVQMHRRKMIFNGSLMVLLSSVQLFTFTSSRDDWQYAQFGSPCATDVAIGYRSDTLIPVAVGEPEGMLIEL